MLRRTLSRFEPGRLTLRSCIPCNRALPRVPLNRESNPLSLVMSFAFLFVLGFCMVTPALAQNPAEALSSIPGGTPPINATGFAIGTLCPKLDPRASRWNGGLTKALHRNGRQWRAAVDAEPASPGIVIQNSLPRDQRGQFRERAERQYRGASRRPTWGGDGHKHSRVVL